MKTKEKTTAREEVVAHQVVQLIGPPPKPQGFKKENLSSIECTAMEDRL